jgi:hypothetical protein
MCQNYHVRGAETQSSEGDLPLSRRFSSLTNKGVPFESRKIDFSAFLSASASLRPTRYVTLRLD